MLFDLSNRIKEIKDIKHLSYTGSYLFFFLRYSLTPWSRTTYGGPLDSLSLAIMAICRKEMAIAVTLLLGVERRVSIYSPRLTEDIPRSLLPPGPAQEL